MVTTVHGSDGAREVLLGTTRSADAWDPYFVERFLRRGAYLIPHGEMDWEGVPSHVPELEPSSDPDAWHPEDALMVPMRGADGTLLGVVSVDEPESGLRPTDEELDVLVAFAEHVAGAIEAAQDVAAAARDRASLAQLLEVSASLVDLESVDSVLAAVAKGIQDALEFEKVAVCLATEEGGYVPAGTAGWAPGAPELDFRISTSDLDALFAPEFETEGCWLVDHATASKLVASGSQYRSQRNGRGPLAWNRHWLIVPLIERDGSRSRLHLGGRPRGLPASFPRAAPGAPNVREPGNDGDSGRGGLRDAQCPQHRAGGAARHRGALARAAKTPTACSPRSCRARARSSARRTGFSRSSIRRPTG